MAGYLYMPLKDTVIQLLLAILCYTFSCSNVILYVVIIMHAQEPLRSC